MCDVHIITLSYVRQQSIALIFQDAICLMCICMHALATRSRICRVWTRANLPGRSLKPDIKVAEILERHHPLCDWWNINIHILISIYTNINEHVNEKSEEKLFWIYIFTDEYAPAIYFSFNIASYIGIYICIYTYIVKHKLMGGKKKKPLKNIYWWKVQYNSS